MSRMKTAIASTDSAKVEALKEAWLVFGSNLMDDPDDSLDFFAYDISRKGRELLFGVEEIMAHASERVESLILQLKREKRETDYYVALESGFSVVARSPRRQVFLESWAYVSDGFRNSWGRSGGILVPGRLADPVIDREMEPGFILDLFKEKNGITVDGGIWSVLTRDVFNEKHSFVTALINAFAPFYNQAAYA